MLICRDNTGSCKTCWPEQMLLIELTGQDANGTILKKFCEVNVSEVVREWGGQNV
jgi:hypothetical protein